jgi:DNA-binding CsgD family transcriptional regulator
MKTTDPFPAYIQYVQGHGESDTVDAHGDMEPWITIAPCAVYMISYLTNNYVYINGSFERMVGVPWARINDRRYWSREDAIHPADKEILQRHVIANNMSFFSIIPREQHSEYLIRNTYRVRTKNGGLRMVLQESFFIQSTPDRKPLMALGFITDITELKTDATMIWEILHEGKVVRSERYIPSAQYPELTKRQIEIMLLFCRGFTIRQAAFALNRSERTIKGTREEIYRRTGSHCIADLMNYARKHDVL